MVLGNLCFLDPFGGLGGEPEETQGGTTAQDGEGSRLN